MRRPSYMGGCVFNKYTLHAISLIIVLDSRNKSQVAMRNCVNPQLTGKSPLILLQAHTTCNHGITNGRGESPNPTESPLWQQSTDYKMKNFLSWDYFAV